REATVEHHMDPLTRANTRRPRLETAQGRRDRSPSTGSVDYELCAANSLLPGFPVAISNAAHPTIVALEDLGHRGMHPHGSAVLDCVDGVAHAEPRSIDPPLVEGDAAVDV